MARDKKTLDNFKGFIEDTEQVLGHKIKPTTGGRSANHKPGKRKQKNGKGALDLGRNNSGLTSDAKKRKVARIALRRGLNVGFESNHLHIDDNEDKINRTFSRNTEGKKALKKSRKLEALVKSDHKKEVTARGKMNFGSVESDKLLSDFRKKSKRSVADIRKSDDSNTPISNKPTLSDKLKGISQIDPQGSNKQENIDAVLSNDPTKLVPQITPSTPRLAMRQDQDGTPLGRVQSRRNFEDEEIQKDKRTLVEKVQEASKFSTEEEQIKGLQAAKEDHVTQEQEVIQYRQGEDIINTTDKKTINKQVDSFFGEDKENAKDVKEDIQNKKTGKERKGGPTSQFTEALTFFLPQLLGGLVGGAIGGTEGAVEGSQLAGGSRDAFLKHKESQGKSQLAQDKFDNQILQKDEDQAALGLGGGVKDKVGNNPQFRDTRTGKILFNKTVKGIPGFYDDNDQLVKDDGVSIQRMESLDRNKRNTRLENQSSRNFKFKSENDERDFSRSQTQFRAKAISDFTKFTKDDKTALDNLTQVKKLLSRNMLSSDQLATSNAKAIFGESRITDEDVARADIAVDLLTSIRNAPVEALTGVLGPAKKKAAMKMLNAIQFNRTKELKDKAKELSNEASAQSGGITRAEQTNSFLNSLGFKRNKTTKDIKDMTDAEVKAYMGVK